MKHINDNLQNSRKDRVLVKTENKVRETLGTGSGSWQTLGKYKLLVQLLRSVPRAHMIIIKSHCNNTN